MDPTTADTNTAGDNPKVPNKYLKVSFLLVAAFAAGFLLKDPIARAVEDSFPTTPAVQLDFSYLNGVLTELENNFVDPQKIDQNKLIYGAAKGMVEASGDPYTTFFDPTETKNFQDDISGYFSGVGLQVEIKNKELTVVAPLKDTPAFKAGILAGDEIYKINGTSTVDMSANEAVSLIKGEKGTEVTLAIFRQGWSETKDFKMVRDTIKVPSIELKYMEKDGKKIAHLTLFQFSETVYSDFQEAARDISKNKAQGIILDLRNNPGGLLESARDIAGWFLKDREIVLQEKSRNGQAQNDYASGPSTFVSTPLVVLINSGSASASEILAAALRDNRNVDIIGETSFGKGSVQRLIELSDNSSLKVTIAKWLTPKGEAIDGQGIKPTIEVKMTDEDYQQEKDPQLDKALEAVSSKI
jgi:carboxyl-terminal processing protease